jgi:hypothetical protein
MMKKFLFLSLILISVAFNSIKAQSALRATSLGIVIYSNDTETIWNALRLANYSKTKAIR